MRQRPQGMAFVFYRKRWPAVAAVVLGLIAMVLVWNLAGFFLGLVAGAVMGAVTYRWGHSSGSRQ